MERQWNSHELNHDSLLSWDEYKNVTYGFLSEAELAGAHGEGGFDYKEMVARDRNRFTAADGDKDDKLTQVCFSRLSVSSHDHKLRSTVFLTSCCTQSIQSHPDGEKNT